MNKFYRRMLLKKKLAWIVLLDYTYYRYFIFFGGGGGNFNFCSELRSNSSGLFLVYFPIYYFICQRL